MRKWVSDGGGARHEGAAPLPERLCGRVVKCGAETHRRRVRRLRPSRGTMASGTGSSRGRPGLAAGEGARSSRVSPRPPAPRADANPRGPHTRGQLAPPTQVNTDHMMRIFLLRTRAGELKTTNRSQTPEIPFSPNSYRNPVGIEDKSEFAKSVRAH